MAKSRTHRPTDRPHPDEERQDLAPEPKETSFPFSDVDESPTDLVDETIELSQEAAELIRQLETERDEAVAARTRALADYSNFQRRAMENEQQALRAGESRVVRSMIPVLDNFDLALNQDLATLTVEQLVSGVQLVRGELYKALEAYGVKRIEPEIGSPFDPNCHEAVLRQPSPGCAPNTVVMVLQSGYRMGEIVLRPAKVAVAPPEE